MQPNLIDLYSVVRQHFTLQPVSFFTPIELITTDVTVQLDTPVTPHPVAGSFEQADLHSPPWWGYHLSQTAIHQTAAAIVSDPAPSG